jgi:excisionase family DNA binding protein
MPELLADCIGKETGRRYVTVTEAAHHLRVSRNTIYDACRENEMEFIRIRSTMRVLIDSRERYLTVAEAATYLNVSPSTIYDACSLNCGYGQLPHIRIRSRIRIPVSKLIGGGQEALSVEAAKMPRVYSL